MDAFLHQPVVTRHSLRNTQMQFINRLPLKLLNFLNGIIHLLFLKLSIIIFKDIKIRTWSANSIAPGQTAGLALYQWQRLITLVPFSVTCIHACYYHLNCQFKNIQYEYENFIRIIYREENRSDWFTDNETNT